MNFKTAIANALIELRPKHRRQYNDLDWALLQPKGEPAYILGDVVKCIEGGVGVVVKVCTPQSGWPAQYALDPVAGQPKPPRFAWFYEGDIEQLVRPSAIRTIRP